jgi:hypothetical protein
MTEDPGPSTPQTGRQLRHPQDVPGSSDQHQRPSFYAARSGGWHDWWTLLHPPYTAWHLSYVVFGACLATHVSASRLVATLLAFFLAVGIAAHALDELHGRPLGTHISRPMLVTLTVVSLAGAVALGALGVWKVGWALVPFIVIGPVLVVGYNMELFGGRIHTDVWFAAAWGSFPVLVAYVAQSGNLSAAAVIAAVAAFFVSAAQRHLSTPARLIRRRSATVEGTMSLRDGSTLAIDKRTLLLPLERALLSLSWGLVFLATAFAIARMA